MLYEQYTIGGELMHSSKGAEWKSHRYIDKVKTKNGKWRYIYKNPSSKYLRKAAGNSADNAANKTTINQINQRYEYLRKKDPAGADQYLTSMANKYKGTRIGEWINNKFKSTFGSEKPKMSLEQEKANYEIEKGRRQVEDNKWKREELRLKNISDQQDKNFAKVETVTKPYVSEEYLKELEYNSKSNNYPKEYERINNHIDDTKKKIEKANKDMEEKQKNNKPYEEMFKETMGETVEEFNEKKKKKKANDRINKINSFVDPIIDKLTKKKKKKK